jgi:hypothetical protein
MGEIKEESKLREAEIDAEMKDLGKLRNILSQKIEVFNKRNSELRRRVLENLRALVTDQLKALDEEYALIGMDKQSWQDEENMIMNIEDNIKAGKSTLTDEQRAKIMKAANIENEEGKQIDMLIALMKEYIAIVHEELKQIDFDNMEELKKLILQEEQKIAEIGKMITMEEKEEREAEEDTV